jgi:hypothetical protein
VYDGPLAWTTRGLGFEPPVSGEQHAGLLTAAAAEAVGRPVLHDGEDDDRIAAVTGQSAFWLAERGSLG